MRHRFTAVVRPQKGPPNPDYRDPDLKVWDLTKAAAGTLAKWCRGQDFLP